MKKELKYMIVGLLGICMGCSNWLDVNPQGEVRDKEEFGSEDGFKEVLTGVYIQMASQELYGRNLTMQYTELMAQHWKAEETGTNGAFRNFRFKETKPELLTIWNNYYKAIVNVNLILQHIDDQQALFKHGNYELIKGEALGLRAFLHFDILRLWGPSPVVAKGEEIAIPYVTEMTKQVDKLISLPYSEVLKKIGEDLDAAEKLLANDPIIACPFENFLRTAVNKDALPEDEFQDYRQNRFNYYAVKAAKARFYLWQGDKEKAFEHAKAVMDALDPDGTVKYTLATGSQMGEQVFPSEHIFSLHNGSLADIIKPTFQEYSGLEQDNVMLQVAYETGLSPDDIRFAHNKFWEEKSVNSTSKVHNFFLKYDHSQQVPLMRLSEMYLIAMECGSLSEAGKLFSAYRISRNLSPILDNGFADEPALEERLEKEYRKEFYGEGIMFFWYKRKGVTTYTWPVQKIIELTDYRWPKPQEQTMFE